MIKHGETGTKMIEGVITLIAAMSAMIDLGTAMTGVLAIGTAIGMKTAIAYIRTGIVTATMRHMIAMIVRPAVEDTTAATASGVDGCQRRISTALIATTHAGSAIAKATIKARPRAWTDVCGISTRTTVFLTMFPSTRLHRLELVQ